MKQLLIFLISLIVSHCVFAQNNDVKIVGQYRSEYFVLQENGYYVVERLSPLMYESIKYDTLFPASKANDTFSGKTYTLLFKKNEVQLVSKKSKGKGHNLKPVDDEAIENRNRKYNYFSQIPYEEKMSQYARLLSKQNKNKYESFNKDRRELYDRAEDLGIEDFKSYFNTFLKKYNLQQ